MNIRRNPSPTRQISLEEMMAISSGVGSGKQKTTSQSYISKFLLKRSKHQARFNLFTRAILDTRHTLRLNCRHPLLHAKVVRAAAFFIVMLPGEYDKESIEAIIRICA